MHAHILSAIPLSFGNAYHNWKAAGPYLRIASIQCCREAVKLSGGEPRVRAGLYGNIGALLMGAAGRLEDALEYTDEAIEAGKEVDIPDPTLTAGKCFCCLEFSTSTPGFLLLLNTRPEVISGSCDNSGSLLMGAAWG